MEHSEEGQPPKPEKSSPPAEDQNNVLLYPDWAAMQAYYGPRFAIPYLNSTVASPYGHHSYLWVPPQSVIPPNGAPYPALYAHGGFFGGHTGVPIAGAGFSTEASAKLSGNTDGGFMKKLKEFDGLKKSKKDNGKKASGEHGTDHRLSESEDTEGSSDGSNGGTPRVGESRLKRTQQGSPNHGEAKKKCHQVPTDGCKDSAKPTDSANTLVDKIENTTTAVSESEDPSHPNMKMSPNNTTYPSIPCGETWLQEERQIKRERRKQSNRESARRSRLRKQAEMEELTGKVQVLISENTALKSEINKLMVTSKKLKLDNVDLMVKLKAAIKEGAADVPRLKPDGTQNLLERVNENVSTANDGVSYERRNPIAKLHQLLDPNHRTDAVAAS